MIGIPMLGMGVFGDPLYDYYIDAALGNDSNPGTSGLPWKSLSKLTHSVVTHGVTTKVLVRAGTYDTALDYVNFTGASLSSPPANTKMEITFEEGCVMDGTAANAIAPTPGFEQPGGAWTLEIFGNGLEVNNYSEPTGDSPNGFGNRGTTIMIVRDCHTSNCDDGFSAHDAAQMYLYDCSSDGTCEKSEFLHVGTSYVEHHRCTFNVRASQVNGSTSGTPTLKFFDCRIIPLAAGGGFGTGSGVATFEGGQIGDLTTRVNLSGANLTVTDAYTHLLVEGNQNVVFEECFGRISTRHRNNTGAGIRLRNCVFVDGAAGSTDSALFYNSPFGSQGPWNAENCVFTGFTTAVGSSYDATAVSEFIAANNYVRNCLFHNNSTNIHALLAASAADITETVTANPLIGPANTVNKADYGYGPGSPCIGAGTSGSNIGFPAA